jgi:tetratricopeptide (TPR) repeat protein
MSSRSRALVVAALAVCLVVLLGGQAIADSSLPRGFDASTGRTMGRAGYAFVSGLRTFVAASLWNRLDPQLHDYYQGVPMDKQLYLVPNMRLVTLLDPQIEDAYYVLPWILAKNGKVTPALSLAREGAQANPRSGKLAAAYAQILDLYGHDPKGAAKAADVALSDKATWADLSDEWTGLKVIADVYRAAGDQSKATEALARAAALEKRMGELGINPLSEEH